MSLKCTTCNSTCKLVEKGYNRFFCNTSCQRKYYVNLKVEADEEGPAVDDDDIIGLESSDGYKFRVTRKECESMKTVKDLVDTITPKDTQQYITIPSITGKMLGRNIDFIRNHGVIIESIEDLIEIINSANYLNHESFILDLLDDIRRKVQRPDIEKLLKMDRNIFETFILISNLLPQDLKILRKGSPDFFEKYDNVRNREITAMMIYSITIGNILAVKYYVKIVDIGRINDEPFITAAKYGHVEILEILRPQWMNFNSYRRAIVRAIEEDRNDAVEYLLRIDQEVSIPSEAIIKAAGKRDLAIFRMLKRDPRVKVYKSIPKLIEFGHLEILKELQENIIEYDNFIELLSIAITFNQYDTFKWMFEELFNLEFGERLLVYAAENHSYEIFEYLIEASILLKYFFIRGTM